MLDTRNPFCVPDYIADHGTVSRLPDAEEAAAYLVKAEGLISSMDSCDPTEYEIAMMTKEERRLWSDVLFRRHRREGEKPWRDAIILEQYWQSRVPAGDPWGV